MAIIVENGSLVTGANSYVTTAELTTYATARGIILVAGAEQLLVKAMDYIESLNFKGVRFTRDQSLSWPRSYVVIDGYYLDSDEIPKQLKNGQMETAIAIDQGEDPLLTSPRRTVRERVDVVEVEYANNSASLPINRRIVNALAEILAGGGSGNVMQVSKG